MDFETEIADRRKAEANAARDKYNALLLKASQGKPTKGDIAELDRLMLSLSIDPAEAAASVRQLKTYFSNLEIVEMKHEIEGECVVTEKARVDYDGETLRLMEELKSSRWPKYLELCDGAAAAAKRKAELEAAMQQNAEIIGALWEMLGIENPAITARIKHLWPAVYGRDCPTAEHSVVAFGAIIESPQMFNYDDGYWRTMPGQSESDLAEMLAIGRAWRDGKIRQPRFIAPAEAVHLADAIRNTPMRQQPPDPSGFTYVRGVGQTADELVELVSKMTKAWNAHRWNARLQPLKAEFLVWPGCVDAPGQHATVDYYTKSSELDARYASAS